MTNIGPSQSVTFSGGIGFGGGDSSSSLSSVTTSYPQVLGGSLVGIEYEPLVRPYEASDPYATSKIRRLIARRPGPFDGEATARWGRPANFETRAPDTVSHTIQWPEDEEEIEVQVPEMIFDELDREEEEVRVENPDDPEQYVIEARPTQVRFLGPDLRPDYLLEDGLRFSQIIYTFNYEYPEGGVA